MANSKKRNSTSKVIEIPVVVTPQVTPPVEESFVLQEAVWYPIDFNKVKTLDDIKLILSKMHLGVMSNVPDFEELKTILSDKPTKQ